MELDRNGNVKGCTPAPVFFTIIGSHQRMGWGQSEECDGVSPVICVYGVSTFEFVARFLVEKL